MIKTHKTGMNKTVNVRLPRLPAKKVHASHYPKQSQQKPCSKHQEEVQTLSGSSRPRAVTTGMYVIAHTDPIIQI